MFGSKKRSEGSGEVTVEGLEVSAYEIPTETPQSDGTAEWKKTTLVVVELRGGGKGGLGYTYADTATARFIQDVLRDQVVGFDAMAPNKSAQALTPHVRNHGRAGVGAMAISAIDAALWDLKARLLGVPLCTLFGQVREEVPLYGSGGFTSYSLAELERHLSDWVERGFRRVKMKVGREPDQDVERVRVARQAVGKDVELMVDANGAYDRKQALQMAERFAEHGVSWFEEPVTSEDLEGLRLVRDRAPALMQIAAGEYGYTPAYFQTMLTAGAVDTLQADATRCLGLSGFWAAAQLCDAFAVPFSAHCAPALHRHVGLAVPRLVHLEYFFDHQRIESMLFDGAPAPVKGTLRAESGRTGLGLELRREDAAKFQVRF